VQRTEIMPGSQLTISGPRLLDGQLAGERHDTLQSWSELLESSQAELGQLQRREHPPTEHRAEHADRCKSDFRLRLRPFIRQLTPVGDRPACGLRLVRTLAVVGSIVSGCSPAWRMRGLFHPVPISVLPALEMECRRGVGRERYLTQLL
jgi:hypothetical protein